MEKATVQFNYHIFVDRMLYSVPYKYIKRKVNVQATDTIIEIFYNHNRIVSHRRLYGRKGQYSTVTEHMPTITRNIWNRTITVSANELSVWKQRAGRCFPTQRAPATRRFRPSIPTPSCSSLTTGSCLNRWLLHRLNLYRRCLFVNISWESWVYYKIHQKS